MLQAGKMDKCKDLSEFSNCDIQTTKSEHLQTSPSVVVSIYQKKGTVMNQNDPDRRATITQIAENLKVSGCLVTSCWQIQQRNFRGLVEFIPRQVRATLHAEGEQHNIRQALIM